MQKVFNQMFISMVCIAPVISLWLGYLFSLKLHWVQATLVDQFLFSPLFNAYIFYYIGLTLDGGLSMTLPDLTRERLDLTISLKPAVLPSLLSFAPIWKTQLTAYPVWLPATLLREKVVPPHLQQLFMNAVAFVWNIIFALLIG